MRQRLAHPPLTPIYFRSKRMEMPIFAVSAICINTGENLINNPARIRNPVFGQV